MNIHSIHFEEGIKPRLRSARETRLKEEGLLPTESFQPGPPVEQEKTDQAKWRAARTPSQA
jgi:hypothetical protein